MTRKKKEAYRLTDDEVKLLEASSTNPNLFFQYWFSKPGGEPFQLDKNFTDEGKWQEDMCMTNKNTILAICGISTGKTLAVGLSACYHATITPDFRFLNMGHELDQAKIMYDNILDWYKNTRFEKLIKKAPATPRPKIEIEFYVGDYLFSSILEFYSAGETQDASNIFSKRYDWINVEEAGRFSGLTNLIARLTTRLTGSTSSGRPYMARLSLISNPIDNPELWSFFDQAVADPEHYAVYLIDTEMNKNTTPEQVALQMRNIPKEEQAFYLKGERPEGKGIYFSRSSVALCEQLLLSEQLKKGIADGIQGYKGIYTPALGYYDYEFPYDNNYTYTILGDPGTGTAPERNAPVVAAFKVIEPDQDRRFATAYMIALWWGNGMGSILPFYDKLMQYIEKYQPLFAGIDNTSTQKHSAELANQMYFSEPGEYSVVGITGMDFSGRRKYTYLQSLRLTMEAGGILYPDIAREGASAQLKAYDPIKDRTTNSKLPQDIVAVLSMAAFAHRQLFPPLYDDEEDEDRPADRNHRSSRAKVTNGRLHRSTTRTRAGR